MPRFKVVTGIEYDGKRAEPGDIVDDIPTKSVTWLVEQGIVEKIDGDPTPPPPKREPKKSPTTIKGEDD